jgi:hypothetical protein
VGDGGLARAAVQRPVRDLTSVAVLFAFAGTSAFALNLVLGARLRPVETFVGGLDRMYRVHRINGQLAYGLLCHVALILASRATLSLTTALDLIGPGAGWTVFAGVLAFIAFTISIGLTLRCSGTCSSGATRIA